MGKGSSRTVDGRCADSKEGVPGLRGGGVETVRLSRRQVGHFARAPDLYARQKSIASSGGLVFSTLRALRMEMRRPFSIGKDGMPVIFTQVISGKSGA